MILMTRTIISTLVRMIPFTCEHTVYHVLLTTRRILFTWFTREHTVHHVDSTIVRTISFAIRVTQNILIWVIQNTMAIYQTYVNHPDYNNELCFYYLYVHYAFVCTWFLRPIGRVQLAWGLELGFVDTINSRLVASFWYSAQVLICIS